MEKAFQALSPLTQEEATRIEEVMAWGNAWESASAAWSATASKENHAR
jgi:hypothetical protein